MNDGEFIRVNMVELVHVLKNLKLGGRINLMKTSKNRFIIVTTEFDPDIANSILTAKDLNEKIH